jgi:FkbH-like protein
MFQLQWANEERWRAQENSFSHRAALKRDAVRYFLNTVWEEHCVECAVPECYSSCPLYRKRDDGACARFVYGIMPNTSFQGRFRFGADITFRKWGKLEASIQPSYPTGDLPHAVYRWLDRMSPEYRELFQNFMLKKYFSSGIDLDCFVIECFSPSAEPFNLMVEYFVYDRDHVRKTMYRTSLAIVHGLNSFSIPFANFNLSRLEGYLYVYPEESLQDRRLIFLWLDFVKLKETVADVTTTIKCVAWDLDNTLWSGVISDEEDVVVNEEALALIRKLDEKGILQTIVSKNDHAVAWNKITALHLEEYFLHPAINWRAKSENIRNIAQRLNIGLDSIGMIDDSDFERAEIAAALPQVRLYSPGDIPALLHDPEFNTSGSEVSRTRRLLYLENIRREAFRDEFPNDYDNFIRSCAMNLRIYSPEQEEDIARCHELIQRSNQLNLSLRRYSIAQLNELLSMRTIRAFALACDDRFGSYGIIGFCTVSLENDRAEMIDFVLSCRAAQKKIEVTFFKTLVAYLEQQGHPEVNVTFTPNKKNGGIRKVFEALGLLHHSAEHGTFRFSMSASTFKTVPELMRVAFELPLVCAEEDG